MAVSYQERTRPERDAAGLGRRASRKLANELGYNEDQVWRSWRELAGHFESELNWPRRCAEYRAVQLLADIYDKRGSEPS